MVLRAQSLGDQLVVAATCSQSPIVEKKKLNVITGQPPFFSKLQEKNNLAYNFSRHLNYYSSFKSSHSFSQCCAQVYVILRWKYYKFKLSFSFRNTSIHFPAGIPWHMGCLFFLVYSFCHFRFLALSNSILWSSHRSNSFLACLLQPSQSQLPVLQCQ